MTKEAKKLLRGAIIIVLMSLLLGIVVNFSLVRRYLSGEFRQSFIDLKKFEGIRLITLAEMEDLFSQKTPGTPGAGAAEAAIFIDSRSHAEFAAGHIPGALNIPLDEVKTGEKKGQGVDMIWSQLAYPVDQALVVYCEGGDCQTSIALAKLIHEKGYRDIRVFSGGWSEWTAAGLPVDSSK